MKNSYIYFHDFVWQNGVMSPIKKGTIVYDVKKVDGTYTSKCLGCPTYEFETENGEKFQCSYTWAFAKNTPKNIKKIKQYDKSCLKLKEVEKEHERLFDEIDFIK